MNKQNKNIKINHKWSANQYATYHKFVLNQILIQDKKEDKKK